MTQSVYLIIAQRNLLSILIFFNPHKLMQQRILRREGKEREREREREREHGH